MLVRPATLQDADHIARIQVETWRSAYAGLITDSHLAGLSVDNRAAFWSGHIAQAEPGKFLLVAESDGAPRGFVSGGPVRGDVGGCRGEIYALYVEAAFQRQGLGAGLFLAGLRRLHELGHPKAAVWVLQENPWRRFYEKMGGRLLGEKELQIGEERHREAGYGFHTEVGTLGGGAGRPIAIVPYDQRWPERFATHAAKIRAALGDKALAIEHVGSTSVPGLGAKDIVDIDVIVADSGDEEAWLPALLAAGYVLRVREPHWQQHRMVRTPEIDVNVHVFSPGAPEHARHLAFRDRLRGHPEERDRYEAVKRELAGRKWRDTNAYAEAKSEVIEAILGAAYRELGGRKP